MKAPTIPRRVWLISSTVAVIGGFFAYYFFVYMEARRDELEAKKFRALAQYADNIKGAYAERTKTIIERFTSGKCKNQLTVECDSVSELRKARLDVIKSVIAQSDFNELLFEVHREIEMQTFRNSVDEAVVGKILDNNAYITRQVEFKVNDVDYVIFIHSFKLANKWWKIFGFCAKNEFESQVKAVDLVYVFSAVLLLIFILLIMPLLKLWIMNESEKLQTVNVWFCGFSLVVGSAFLLLIILMANDLFTGYETFASDDLKKNRNARIKVLSDSIESKFKNELKLIYRQLEKSKNYNQTHRFYTNIDQYDSIQNNSRFDFSIYPYFNEMLWIKEGGNQDFVVATHKLDSGDLVNLGRRTYFSNALHEELSWMMPHKNATKERFALQSIHSYITNNHEAGFGIKYEDKDSVRVLAMATRLRSVMNPLLPPGYQFVVADKTGKVWFHSTIDKNLNENFFDETGRDKNLIAAVEGRLLAPIAINYDRASLQGWVKPIQHTDLFLVVLYDDEYFNTPIVLTVGFAFILVFILLSVQGLHQLILVVVTNRFSLLKIRRFFLTWLRPRIEKKRVYHDAVCVQLILLLFAGGLALFSHSLELVVCFLALPVLLTVYHFFSLKRSYREKEGITEFRRVLKHPFFLTSVVLLLFVNLSGIYFLDFKDRLGSLIIQLLFVLMLLVFYRTSHVTLSSDRDSMNHLDLVDRISFVIRKKMELKFFQLSEYKNAYMAFLFLWLILASIVPTYYFYKVGYYEEGKIWMRFIQLEAAQRQELWDLSLKKEFESYPEKALDSIRTMGDYLNVTFELRSPDSTEFEAIEKSPFLNLMFEVAPSLKGLAEKSRAVLYPNSSDIQWASYERGLNARLEYVNGNGDHKTYQSELLPFRIFKGDYWIVLMVVFILGILLLYRTLRFCITHIFGLGLLRDDSFLINQDFHTKPRHGFKGQRYFVVGLPHSGKNKLIKEISVGIDPHKIVNVDLSEEGVVSVVDGCELIIARNFHMDLNNHVSNQRKLALMETFKDYESVSVVIVSNVDPSAILEFYLKVADYYRNKKNDYELQGNYRICRQAFRKWKQVLGNYSIHYHALKKEEPLANNRFISHELDHGEYLPKLKEQIKESISNRREREEMIIKVQNLSHFYYTSIWNCLTSSEKFLLHDLAKDGFINMRNMKIIRALRQKGLFTARNSLRIMNRSFTNFILSVVEEDADIKIEEEMRKKGSWNTLHLVLVITIISIIVFLGIAQQELFKNFQAIIAFTTALLPLLARFGGIFTGFKDKD